MQRFQRTGVRTVLTLAVGLPIWTVTLPDSSAGDWFWKHPHLRSGLPRYNYGHDDEIEWDSLTTADAVEEQVVLMLRQPGFAAVDVTSGMPWLGSASPSADSVLSSHSQQFIVDAHGVPATDDTDRRFLRVPRQIPGCECSSHPVQPTVVRRKTFAASNDKASLTVNGVTLEDISVVMYETGEVVATGTVSYFQEIPQRRNGRNVSFEITAYGRIPETSPDNNSGAAFVQTSCHYWASHGQVSVIPLVSQSSLESIRRHFDEITHLQIKLYNRHDR